MIQSKSVVILTKGRIFRVHRDQRRIISCCGNAKIVVWDFSKGPQDGLVSKNGSIDVTFF